MLCPVWAGIAGTLIRLSLKEVCLCKILKLTGRFTVTTRLLPRFLSARLFWARDDPVGRADEAGKMRLHPSSSANTYIIYDRDTGRAATAEFNSKNPTASLLD